MNIPNPSTLTSRIQQLLDDRQRHADAMTAIDQTLSQISSLLGPPLPAAKPAKATAATPALKRGAYATTAEQSLLAFIRQKGNPTGRDIQEHWRGEGRPGNSSPKLARLLTAGKVKRTPLEGQRGSRYSLAGHAAKAATAPSRGKRRSYSMTGEESILAFVTAKGSPTTHEIKAHWDNEKRGGRADNALSLLVQAKKLKREPIKDGRGSRYRLP